MPTVYIASYEAARPGQSLPRRAYRQAIQKQAWPYGYGDDPSFFCHHVYGTPVDGEFLKSRGNRRLIQPTTMFPPPV